MATFDTIFTAVSQPGPAEERVLRSLVGRAKVRPRVGAEVKLRTLETERRGPQPTVILLHGRGGAASLWADWLGALGTQQRVVAIDLPGFGHSGAKRVVRRDPTAALEFFVDPIEDVVREEGPVVLVGHSLGGLVALELALRAQLDVRGLVLVGSMGLGPVVLPAARLYLRAGPERLARMTSWLGVTVGTAGVRRRAPGEGPLAALRRELLLVRGGRPLAEEAFNCLVPMFGSAFHRLDRLGEVTAPVLLVWGESDEAFPLPIAIQARTRFRAAELAVLPAGHSPHIDAAPEAIERVARFLGSVEGGVRASSSAR